VARTNVNADTQTGKTNLYDKTTQKNINVYQIKHLAFLTI